QKEKTHCQLYHYTSKFTSHKQKNNNKIHTSSLFPLHHLESFNFQQKQSTTSPLFSRRTNLHRSKKQRAIGRPPSLPSRLSRLTFSTRHSRCRRVTRTRPSSASDGGSLPRSSPYKSTEPPHVLNAPSPMSVRDTHAPFLCIRRWFVSYTKHGFDLGISDGHEDRRRKR
ncbi:hypothetical protein KSS87_006062, partial [Heliosperma pusillum]